MKKFIITTIVCLLIFLASCQSSHITEITREEQDKLGAAHYKNAFDTFFVSKSLLEKFDAKDRSRKIKEQRLKAYKDFKIILTRYPRSRYVDKALISIARIEENYISDYEALKNYKKLQDEFPESKYNFEATQKVNELVEKFVWKIEEFIHQKEYDNAIVVINRIKKISPNFSESYYYLGLIYERRGLYEQAIREWKKLQDNPKAHFLLSCAYYDRKLFQKAIKELVSAIELNKDEPLYYYNLGVIYNEIGNKEKAGQAREAYLNMAEKNDNEKKWVMAIKNNLKRE